MGVKLPDIPKQTIELEDLNGKVIVIDAFNSLYQFLSSIRQKDGTPLMDSHGNITSHLQGLFSRTLNLMQKGIKICYVFDGERPILKQQETEAREHRKRIAEEKLKEAMQEENIEAMAKYSKQTSRLNYKMIEESKELIKSLGLPVIQAANEAEAQCAFIVEKGDAWASGSNDHDSLLFGAPRLIQNLTLARTRKVAGGGLILIKPELIELKKVLKYLNINQDQLIVLGILSGTDYNKSGVKGVGPKTALKLVQQCKDFDTLFSKLNPDFNWKQIYAIFKSMPVMKNYQLKFKELDEDKVKELLVEKHEFNFERIKSQLEKLKAIKQKGLSEFT